jgi:hypothetical protein
VLARATLVLAACGPAPPQPELHSIEPQLGYTDQVTVVKLQGRNFIPAYVFDLEQDLQIARTNGFTGAVGNEQNAAELKDIVWRTPSLLEATLDKGLPGPGTAYTIKLVDPRGQTALLANGFVSLGPDTVAPQIEVNAPSARPVAPDNTVRVDFSARDPGPGSLAALLYNVALDGNVLAKGSCPLAPASLPTGCVFDAHVPPTAQINSLFTITLTALDASAQANTTVVTLPFVLTANPVLQQILPRQGSRAGGTDVVVRGAFLPPDAQAFIGGKPLLPKGGTWLDPSTIVGRTPPGVVGRASVQIRALTGESSPLPAQDFTYIEELKINSVAPARSPAIGAAVVNIEGQGFTPQTVIIFGSRATTGAPLLDTLHLSPNTIAGVVPPGEGDTLVWAVDPLLGKTRWSGTFSWTPEGTPP